MGKRRPYVGKPAGDGIWVHFVSFALRKSQMKVQSEFRVILPQPKSCEEIVDRIAVAFNLPADFIKNEVERLERERKRN